MSESRICLVTGANKGIGYEVARGLGRDGAVVLIGARSVERGAAAAAKLAADGIDARPVRLDVTEPATVTAAAALVELDFGRLDVLVNNAGVAAEWGREPSATPTDLVRLVYDTNVFGVVEVTNAFLPLLRRSPAGRIVNLSSDLGSLSFVGDPARESQLVRLLGYNSSKTAVNALTVAYAGELRPSGIKVNAANPGYCATDLNGHSGPRTAEEGASVVLTLANLPADGPTGAFFGPDGPMAW